MFRHQLPVFSPVPLRALLSGIRGRQQEEGDSLAALSVLLSEGQGAERAILYGSGTQALQVALRVAVDSVGGDVALPAFSCFDVATAAVAAQVPVRFYDVEPQTLAPDIASLGAVLGAGARVIVAGPLYGIPLDWAPVQEIARRHGAVLVEDAAQAHGCWAAAGGDRIFGDLTILSFGRGKGWTGGSGGALLVRNPELEPVPAAVAGSASGDLGGMVLLLKVMAQWALGRPTLYGLPSAVPWLGLGETRYREPTSVGPMGRRAAALALGTREASVAEAGYRRSAAESLLQALDAAELVPDPVRTLDPPKGAMPGYLRLPVLLPDGIGGFPSVGRANALGLAQGYPIPLTELAPLRSFHAGEPPHCPGAELLARSLVTLPTHSLVRGEDRDRIIREMGSYSG